MGRKKLRVKTKVRKLRARGLSYREIARQLGISTTSVIKYDPTRKTETKKKTKKRK